LADTQVTGAGREHLKGLTKLQKLDLYGIQFTDERVKELKQTLPHARILN